jgi:hypothetical protein
MADKQKVNFDRPKLERLKKKMAETEEDIFEFEGCQYVKGYAKYLVHYMESRLLPVKLGARTKA